jgi:AraC-like DNA-binding protein
VSERLFVRLAEDASHGPESSAPAASLRPLAVRRSLEPCVANVLSYCETFAAGDEVVERVLPDGAVRLILHAADAAGPDRLVVVGATASPTLVRLHGRVQGLSIALRPGAAAPLFGMPAGELAERTVPLQDLWPREASALLDDLAAHTANEAKAQVLQQLLQRRLANGRFDASRLATRAVQAIQAHGGRRPLRDVAAALGVGERRLQQIFHEHVGLAPKAVSRLARLHHLMRALRCSPLPAWAELAPDLGFYDQAHLANEFRALCGLTPGQFLARSASGSSKTAA